MTPFETIARIVEAAKAVLIGLIVVCLVVAITLVCMAAWQNYETATVKAANAEKAAKAQVACGEYGNGRAWTAAKRNKFLTRSKK